MSLPDLWPLLFAMFLMGMSKGGFPVGPLSLQLAVLLWPGTESPVRSALGFMLPLLCLMDVCAVTMYRKCIEWPLIRPLLPWAALGVAAATPVFLAKETAVAIPESAIKFCIGCIGLLFVLNALFRARIHAQIRQSKLDSCVVMAGVGVASGIVSVIAHAAGPIMQMYLLPRRQDKQVFAATNVAFFFVINLIKMGPFIATGAINAEFIRPMLMCVPFIPLGVALGYFLVAIMPQRAYLILIYSTLLVTSIKLMVSVILG